MESCEISVDRVTSQDASSSSSFIDMLPKELFLTVLIHVKLSSGGSDLKACLSVSHKWHDAALPLLYRDVVLSNSGLSDFITHFNSSYHPIVESLTLWIVPTTQPSRQSMRNLLEGSPESQAIWRNFDLLANLIPHFKNLTTFSLIVDPDSGAPGFRIPSRVLVSLVDALPEGCVNLELDPRAHDIDPEGCGENHICESLRAVIPRLKHLRLHLRWMCSALLGVGSRLPADSDETKRFKPIALPKMETMVLNCSLYSVKGMYGLRCSTIPWLERITAAIQDTVAASLSVTEAIKAVLQKGGLSPTAKLIVLSRLEHDNEDTAVYAAYTRMEMINMQTVVTPFRQIVGSQRVGYMCRTFDGREFIATSWGVESVAEGQMWRRMVGGARFPAALAMTKSRNSEAYVEAELPIMDAVEWRELNPERSCRLWQNEKLTGLKLLTGEKREGPDEFLSDSPIRESTPIGWLRTNSGLRRI